MRLPRFLSLLMVQFVCAPVVKAQAPVDVNELFVQLKTTNDSVRYNLYSQIGFYYIQQDQFDSSLYYTTISLNLAEKLGSPRMIGNANNNIGNIFRMYSDYDQALQYYSKATAIYDKNGLFKEASRTIANMATIYAEQEQYNKAEELLLQSNSAAWKIRDTITLVNNYASLANSASYQNNTVKARKYIDSGRVLFNPLVGKTAERPIAMQIGYTARYLDKITALQLYNEKKYDSSILLYESLLASLDQERGVKNKVDLLLGVAENYIELKKYELALVRSDTALSLLQQDSIPVSYKNVYRLRSLVFEKLGRFPEAYFSFRQYKAVNDSIVNAVNFKTLASLQTRYETEKKDEQIVQLNRQQKSQRIIIFLAIAGILAAAGLILFMYRSRKLQGRLFRERELLLQREKEMEVSNLRKRMTELEQLALRAQMNPHFIFNSLNTVQHYVMNKDVEGVNKYLGIFAHLVRQTLNNSGREVIPLDEEVKYLDTYLSLEKMKSDNRFSYAIEVGETIDATATFIPGMILQPFVENSIRHGVAYRQHNDGHIRISISKNGKLSCRIEDNGVGRKKAGELKKTGSEPESKGMAITMNRIDTINKIYGADIEVLVEDITGPTGNVEGTKVVVDFPADME